MHLNEGQSISLHREPNSLQHLVVCQNEFDLNESIQNVLCLNLCTASKHGRFYMQNNQLLAKTHVGVEENSFAHYGMGFGPCAGLSQTRMKSTPWQNYWATLWHIELVVLATLKWQLVSICSCNLEKIRSLELISLIRPEFWFGVGCFAYNACHVG